MFDIGWSELLVIAVVLIVVVGPKDLPPMLRAFGKMTQRARRVAGDFRAQFDEALREAELDDVRQTLSDAQKLNPVNSLREAMNPLRQMGQEIKADLQRSTTSDARAKPGEASGETSPDAAGSPNGPEVSLGLPEVSLETPVAPLPQAAPQPQATPVAAPAVPVTSANLPLPASKSPVVTPEPGLPAVAAAPAPKRRRPAATSEDTEAAMAIEGAAKPRRRASAKKTASDEIQAIAAPQAASAAPGKKTAPKKSASPKKDEA